MSVELDPKLVGQIVSQVNTQDDLAILARQLLKVAVERVMAVELEPSGIFQVLTGRP